MNKNYKLDRNFQILMDRWQGKSFGEIAKVHGIASATALTLYRRAELKVFEYNRNSLLAKGVRDVKDFLKLPLMDRKEMATMWAMNNMKNVEKGEDVNECIKV